MQSPEEREAARARSTREKIRRAATEVAAGRGEILDRLVEVSHATPNILQIHGSTVVSRRSPATSSRIPARKMARVVKRPVA